MVLPGLNGQANGSADASAAAVSNGDGVRSFKVLGLASEDAITGMREEVLLLAWLIVLLRTREDGQIRYEWAYDVDDSGLQTRSLVSAEVMSGLQSNVGSVATAIAGQIAPGASSQRESRSASLVLSTGSLSRSEESKDDGSLHLEIRFNDGRLEIRPLWHNGNMLPFTVKTHIEVLADTVQTVLSNPKSTIEECMRPTPSDLDAIWSWNNTLPPTYNFCMHEVISEQAQKFPEKVGISSWDGDLTYGQIDGYSTAIASTLQESGVVLNDVLPICFEKSRWTIVAVLAAMKAGATFVLMDPTLPLARLQNMAVQVGAKTMLSSSDQRDLATEIMPGTTPLVIAEETFTNFSFSEPLPTLATVPASTLMYFIFTSGSTGTPKGVMLSHRSYTSSAFPRAKAVGYNEDSRVLDFASYAFDVSIDSMLLTLGNGGCLCIPSDADRLNDINTVIRNMRVNYAGLTPSVARILDDDVISSLSGLGLGGEAASARDVNTWGQDTRIIIGYGPCECTIGCTVNADTATGRDYISIGTGNGAAIWITDPNDHEKLVPVGSVGELLVEGPIVGQGYLNDPEKTASVFIEDPAWLVTGHGDYAGRPGRLYKTGDLGKYDPDGSGGILFAGRKDTQVKLRGQRVELGEIESQLRVLLPSDMNVIVEVIKPIESAGQATLVAFVTGPSAKEHKNTGDIVSEQISDEMREILATADTELAKVVPRYMVPTAYIPLNYIPVLISGKTDRKRLREFGVNVDLRQLDSGAATNTRDLTELEERLREAWSQILKSDPSGIRLDDNFFALGADSLGAMKLVSVCRAQGLDLSVTNTFSKPTLEAMASVVTVSNDEAETETPAFSMISQDVESASLEASQACGTDQAAVQDIYPCTPTQESLFTFSLKSTKAYVAQRVACIPAEIDLNSWKKAWEKVVAASPILRTRVAQLQEPGLQQVVLNANISWKDATNLAEYLENDRAERMDLGQALARYAIVSDLNSDKRYMVWTVHHVLYDGWSEPLILKEISNALQEQAIETPTEIKEFVKYVRDTDEDAMQGFWRQELNGAVGPQFPRLPSRDYLPTPDAMIERQIPLQTGTGWPFTIATLIRGAWAIVASQYSGSDDVVFGETLTGRDISLRGVERIVGPLIATVPVRIQIRRAGSVESYLQAVQQGLLARTPYQHMGMQNIRKVSGDAQHACEAGTGLVIQPDPEYVGSELGFEYGDVVREALHFNPYPLMVACGINKGGFRICANFDSGLIEIAQMERILAQLEVTCQQLAQGLSRKVAEIACLPEAELNQIWKWNQTAPLAVDESSKMLRADANTKPGSIYPKAVVPWVCNPRNPSLLSPIGCVGELWLEGALLSGETVESPAWLVAGSSDCAGRSGKLQSTGDMVQLRDDGSLIFVGRKENIVPVNGHAFDIAELEGHVAQYLPSGVRGAAAVIQSEGTEVEPELVVFVEQLVSGEKGFELLPATHEIASDASQATICSTIPESLSLATKKLDKFIRDSLPSYMAPSAYIVIDKIPTTTEQVDHASLNQLASKIPKDILTQLNAGFQAAWKKTSGQENLTSAEIILRAAWAKILRVDAEEIDVDDNFFRRGGDSVLAMKLVSSLRSQGHSLTVADIFQHMRLGDAAKRLKMDKGATQTVKPYLPFSLMGELDVAGFCEGVVRPKLADQSWLIRDVYPVTDSQALDVRATVQGPRTSVQYTMMYMDGGIDREKLLNACTDLVKTHDILRTVFIEHESTFLQVVLDNLEVPVTKKQTDGDIQEYVNNLCKEDVSDFHLGTSFKIFHVEANNQECLVLGLSHALYDGMSLPRLLRDLETLYTGDKVTDFVPFSSYIARTLDTTLQSEATTYWRNTLAGSTLSTLPNLSLQPTDKAIFHTKPVTTTPHPDFTTATLLTSAWALVLARRLQTPDITFGNVTLGRQLDLPNIENTIGPCYQLTPVRVPFLPTWTATDLLHHVRQQSASSAAYDFLGFSKIAKECTSWSSETKFFDSITHNQDFEDFDTMPFAGGECRVDIQIPDGDAPYPMKAVSLVKDGQLCVGVVGSERDEGVVGDVLGELAKAVEELAAGQGEVLLEGGVFV